MLFDNAVNMLLDVLHSLRDVVYNMQHLAI